MPASFGPFFQPRSASTPLDWECLHRLLITDYRSLFAAPECLDPAGPGMRPVNGVNGIVLLFRPLFRSAAAQPAKLLLQPAATSPTSIDPGNQCNLFDPFNFLSILCLTRPAFLVTIPSVDDCARGVYRRDEPPDIQRGNDNRESSLVSYESALYQIGQMWSSGLAAQPLWPNLLSCLRPF